MLGPFVVLLAGLSVAIGHLGDVFNALGNLLRCRALFAGAAGDLTHGTDGGLVFLLDFMERLTGGMRDGHALGDSVREDFDTPHNVA